MSSGKLLPFKGLLRFRESKAALKNPDELKIFDEMDTI